jgi:hypothetical protein
MCKTVVNPLWAAWPLMLLRAAAYIGRTSTTSGT